jgi:hypothetical protein
MVVELLENGSVVTESVEYPDPVAKNPREVDITVVRGGGRRAGGADRNRMRRPRTKSDPAVG